MKRRCLRALVLPLLTLSLMTKGNTAVSDTHVRHPLPSAAEIAQLPADGGSEFNRLIFEQSPYLLQHARNPVDWWPWGEEAFAAARQQDKLIFLSVGYATCHWCHVMERESFEDEEIGALLNEAFICIKVDREERPDIDHIYMQVTQAMTGRGGWPMTVVMTPDREPFFAGTYFPPDARRGGAGLRQIVPRLVGAWQSDREGVTNSARSAREFLQQITASSMGGAMSVEDLEQAQRELAMRFDAAHGGFGMQPKFPTPHNLLFLLREWRRTGDAETLEMVEETLQAMRLGGVYDQVGFGFHRYSTDREWLLPHFEKMLYDNALLTIAYTEAYQATGKSAYAQTAREILTYVQRDMTAPGGAFFSAEDADSEGEEGKFYVWSAEEIQQVLGDNAAEFMRVYNIRESGNFHDEATGQATGQNIPHLSAPLSEEQRLALEPAREALLAVRSERIRPLLDDKILTDWNGLMIAAFATAGRGLDEPAFTDAAERAADWVMTHLRDENGRLLKRARGEQAGLMGLLDDHAFLAWGLLELYESTLNPEHLQQSLEITRLMLEHFWDDEAGGFFLTPDDGEELLVRPKEIYDGAIPSGNSVAAHTMLRLARLTGDSTLEDRAHDVFRAFSGKVEQTPGAYTFLMMAVDYALADTHEVVIAGDLAAEDTQAMLRAYREAYLPNTVLLHRPPGESLITELAPFTRSQGPRDGAATAYVCRNQACEAPTTSPEAMMEALR